MAEYFIDTVGATNAGPSEQTSAPHTTAAQANGTTHAPPPHAGAGASSSSSSGASGGVRLPLGCRLYVQHPSLSDAWLRETFSSYGPVLETKVISGDSGFVHVASPQAAQAAIKQMHHAMRDGHAITVEQARDTTAKANTAGGGGGGKTCFKCGEPGHIST